MGSLVTNTAQENVTGGATRVETGEGKGASPTRQSSLRSSVFLHTVSHQETGFVAIGLPSSMFQHFFRILTSCLEAIFALSQEQVHSESKRTIAWLFCFPSWSACLRTTGCRLAER